MLGVSQTGHEHDSDTGDIPVLCFTLLNAAMESEESPSDKIFAAAWLLSDLIKYQLKTDETRGLKLMKNAFSMILQRLDDEEEKEENPA